MPVLLRRTSRMCSTTHMPTTTRTVARRCRPTSRTQARPGRRCCSGSERASCTVPSRGSPVTVTGVGIALVIVGIVALAPDTKQLGTGIALLLVGLVLCRCGARYGRRFTAWFWGLASGAGAVVIITKFATQGVSIGITMVVIGIAFVVGGWLFARALREPDDMVPAAPRVPTG